VALRKLRVAHKLESNVVDNEDLQDVTDANRPAKEHLLDLTKGKESTSGVHQAVKDSCVISVRFSACGKQFRVRIMASDRLSKVFDAFFEANLEIIPTSQRERFKFLFDGQCLTTTQTPSSLDMEMEVDNLVEASLG